MSNLTEKHFGSLIDDDSFLTDVGQINLDNFEKFLLTISAIYNAPKMLQLLKFRIDNKRNLRKQQHLQHLEHALIQERLEQLSLNSQRAMELISNAYDLYNKKSIGLLDTLNDFLDKKAKLNYEVKQKVKTHILDDESCTKFNTEIDEEYILFCKKMFAYHNKLVSECEKQVKQVESDLNLT